MPVIVVGGNELEAGVTTVATGLAHRLAYAGHRVRVERLDGDTRAGRDAAVFASLEFASSSGEPIDAPTIALSEEEMTIVEAPAGADHARIARELGAALVLVDASGDEGPPVATVIANHAAKGGALHIPEDRLLAAPTVGLLIEASGARVLARSVEGDDALCEHLVIGPISEDSNEPHFARFARKAVVTRAEKVDIALAALGTETRCLILTGGADPSPYLLDRIAAERSTTLLLAPGSTVQTVSDIQRTFGSSPFSGDEKVERAGQLMAASIDDAALAALLGGS